jgi:hypothetical protein
MNRPDETIERVLGGLRDVEAPEGLEQRVMEKMAQVRAAGRSKWAPAMSWTVCGGAALTMLAVSLVAAKFHGGGRHQAPVVAVRRPAVELHAASPVRASRVLPVAAPRHSRKAPAREPAQELGFPAPPMPLTDQEKLLLWLAHRSDPVQVMAMLNPEARALRDAEGDAEFNSFFPPPPKTEEETQPPANEKGETR